MVAVVVPVRHREMVRYLLAAVLLPERLGKILVDQTPPEGWVAAINDQDGILIARTRDAETFVGKPATARMREESAKAQQGWFRNIGLDGREIYAAFSRSRLSGWTVVLVVPAADIEAPLRRSLLMVVAGGLGSVCLAIALAAVVGRRVARSMASLSSAAGALGRSEVPALGPSSVAEIGEIGRVIEAAAAERRRAEDALRASEEEFRTAFGADPVGKAQQDLQTGRYLRVNRKLCEMLGYAAEERLARTFLEVTHPEDRSRDLAALQALARGELREHFTEKRYLRADGAVLWAQVDVAVIRDAAGRPLRYLSTIQDITERKSAEEALRASEARFRRLVEANIIGIAIADGHGRIWDGNEAFLQIVGFTREEVRAGRARWDKRTPPEYLAVSRQMAERLRETGVCPPTPMTAGFRC